MTGEMKSIRDQADGSIQKIHSDLVSASLYLRDPVLRVIATDDVIRQLSIQVFDCIQGVKLCMDNMKNFPIEDESSFSEDLYQD
jgi:hypothetical protein